MIFEELLALRTETTFPDAADELLGFVVSGGG